MAENPLVVVQVPEFIEDSLKYDTKYRSTVKWDVEKGDFVLDGANRMVECSGEEGFMIWCLKIVQTERYACLAYPKEIGAELEAALGEDKEKIVESMVERTITDALKVNPRTESVSHFSFTWDADEMHCSFLVKGMDWDRAFQITL